MFGHLWGAQKLLDPLELPAYETACNTSGWNFDCGFSTEDIPTFLTWWHSSWTNLPREYTAATTQANQGNYILTRSSSTSCRSLAVERSRPVLRSYDLASKPMASTMGANLGGETTSINLTAPRFPCSSAEHTSWHVLAWHSRHRACLHEGFHCDEHVSILSAGSITGELQKWNSDITCWLHWLGRAVRVLLWTVPGEKRWSQKNFTGVGIFDNPANTLGHLGPLTDSLGVILTSPLPVLVLSHRIIRWQINGHIGCRNVGGFGKTRHWHHTVRIRLLHQHDLFKLMAMRTMKIIHQIHHILAYWPAWFTCKGMNVPKILRRSEPKSRAAPRRFSADREMRRGAWPWTTDALITPRRPASDTGIATTVLEVSTSPLPYLNWWVSELNTGGETPCCCHNFSNSARVHLPMIVRPHSGSKTPYPGQDTRATSVKPCAEGVVFLRRRTLSRRQRSSVTAGMNSTTSCSLVTMDATPDAAGVDADPLEPLPAPFTCWHSRAQCPRLPQRWHAVFAFISSTSTLTDRRSSRTFRNFRAFCSLLSSARFSFHDAASTSATSASGKSSASDVWPRLCSFQQISHIPEVRLSLKLALHRLN